MQIAANRWICSIVLMIVAFASAAPAAGATKVYLLAGQSNMVGRGVCAELDPPYDDPLPAVNFWNNGSWTALRSGFGFTADHFGPEVSFGRAIAEAFPDDDIYLVKYGVGATNLAVDWKPDGSGPCYNALKSTVDAALADLRADNRDPAVAGMLWMQGESDAQNSGYATAYQANLTDFIQSVREDFGASGAPFVIGRITAFYGTPEDNNKVRLAQQTVAELDDRADWFSTDDLQIGAVPGHYGTQGQIDLGLLYAEKLTVPEPSTLIILATGTPLLFGRLRKACKLRRTFRHCR
ncbi:MAG: PEP-CTERM sorting domain-containing protein [Pirellulales bacterium]|nr:PEP-CTERM sorting domain-containing protein [Pirellulales bacterium]